MYKKRILVAVIFCVLISLIVCCPTGYSVKTLTLDDLEAANGTLHIDSDSTLTINEGESLHLKNVTIHINGTDATTTEFELTNNGELIIENTYIYCDHARFTLINNGTLNLQTYANSFYLTSNSTVAINNLATCDIQGINVQVYSGYFYFTNTGSLTINNAYFKDQYDGTSIANYGTANLISCTFVTNGAHGKIDLLNEGDLHLYRGIFDANYGGKMNINNNMGTLNLTEVSVDVSGASHGQRSQVNIALDGDTEWNNCSFVNNEGNINCLNTGVLSVRNFSSQNVGTNSATNLESNGALTLEDAVFHGSGVSLITNRDSMTLVNSNCTSSQSMLLINYGELTTENWLIKTTSSTAIINVINNENATITFDTPFIENVSSETLSSIGPEGQQFADSTGGEIIVTNNGLIKQVTPTNSQDYLLYILVLVVAVITALFIIFTRRKKSSN